MDTDNLGPNGALIRATDLIAEEEDLQTEILSLNADIVLVDTPARALAERNSHSDLQFPDSKVNAHLIDTPPTPNSHGQ